MAALAVDSARRAREQAAEQRRRAFEARLVSEERLVRGRALLAVGCTECARRHSIRASMLASPWSTLPWQQPDGELDVVLTLV